MAEKQAKRKSPRQVERKLPPAGTVLVGRFRGEQVTALIVEATQFPEGKAVKVGDRLFRSLSGAARTVTKQSTNGWRFWKW